MMTSKWDFRPVAIEDGEIIQDPVQSEFFTTESVNGLSQALVRETIQNAMDARAGIGPVNVRFDFVTVAPQKYAPFFNLLKPHLLQGRNILREMPDFNTTISCLVVEDFGTHGLLGDVNTSSLKNDNDRNNFFYFWRNVGRSGKSEDSRGRWGLGKTVFPASSSINTFFGITCRSNDHRHELFLMGQAILKNHRLADKDYNPYGFFGSFDSGKHFAKPVRDQVECRQFCNVFRLHRENQPGLSVVIPLPSDDITLQSITQAVIQQYFYPLLQGDLMIEVGDKKIDHQTISQVIGSLKENSETRFKPQIFDRTVRFGQWAISLPENEYHQLTAPIDATKSPDWSEYTSQIESARSEFDAQDKIAFIIPVKVQLEHGQPEIARFRLYLERDDTLNEAENYFIREGVTISGVRTLKQRGLRGFVIIDSKPLTTLLGDAENPAHTEWQKDSVKFRGKYKHGPTCLSFVKRSLPEIARILTERVKQLDKDLLQDIFFVEPIAETEPSGHDQTPRQKPGQKTLPEKPEIESRSEPLLLINSVQGGVYIRNNPKSNRRVSQATIRFAYDIRTGDPFKRYVAADFDLNTTAIQIREHNINIRVREGNTLEFEVLSAEFEVEVTGFDPHRDLKVRLSPRGNAE